MVELLPIPHPVRTVHSWLWVHLHVIKGLEVLRNWLRNCYLVEATAEWRHLQLHGGSLDRLPFPCSYEDQWPGNEGPFYHSRGIHPNKVEPTPENAPHVANTMLEALAHHNHRQSKARDCQEYQWQQDNTKSLHLHQWTKMNPWIWKA